MPNFFMSATGIIFEQPLNEHIRFSLRLEYLFQKAKYHLENDSSWGSRFALETILEILSVVDRPDLKTKLAKALQLYAASLANLLGNQKLCAELDEKKLRRVHDELVEASLNLQQNRGKVGQDLRDNEFITTISQRLATAGGTCDFSVPAYHLWLQQPAKARRQYLDEWIDSFAELARNIALLLKLTRSSVDLHTAKATNGFYQIDLDPRISYQMVRVAVPEDAHCYPEISVGRHRISIHFYALNLKGRPLQTKKDLTFQLACCRM
ncbi:MAG: cell division protein ZapD [Gammaproteobacteria bacterium]